MESSHGLKTSSTPSKSRTLFTQALKITIAFSLIYWMWSSGKLDFATLGSVMTLERGLLGLLLVTANIFFCSERWRFLLSLQDRILSRWEAFKLSLIGIFFNYAMPGGVGGDVVKAFYFHKDHPQSKVVAVSSVLIDRVLGLYAMILMGLAVMIYDLRHVETVPQLQSLFYVVLIVFALGTAGLYCLFSNRLYQTGFLKKILHKVPMSTKLLKLYESFYSYGRIRGSITRTVLISILAQAFSILFLILVGSAVAPEISGSTYFLVAPLGFIVNGLPITPAGIGVSQAAFYFLFNVYTGFTSSIGATVITAFQVTQLVCGLVGAVFYLQRHQPVADDILNSELGTPEDTTTKIPEPVS